MNERRDLEVRCGFVTPTHFSVSVFDVRVAVVAVVVGMRITVVTVVSSLRITVVDDWQSLQMNRSWSEYVNCRVRGLVLVRDQDGLTEDHTLRFVAGIRLKNSQSVCVYMIMAKAYLTYILEVAYV